MNIAAYCRVSTDKADQLNSLEAQKGFFSEYTQRTGDNFEDCLYNYESVYEDIWEIMQENSDGDFEEIDGDLSY